MEKLHARRNRVKRRAPPPPTPITYPQVALVALNPHTGQVLALVGGRSYGTSQVNHAVAHRPTGSIFKPFVYAAAFQTAVEGTPLPGQDKLFSPVTMLTDQQSTYMVGDKEYSSEEFRRQLSRPGHGPLCAAVVAQQRHHRTRFHGGLRSRGGAGPRRRRQERARNTVRRHRLL